MLSLQLPDLTVHQVSTEYPPGRINGQSTISILDRYRSILFTISEKIKRSVTEYYSKSQYETVYSLNLKRITYSIFTHGRRICSI